MLERDKVLEAIRAMHGRGMDYVSLSEVQDELRGVVNANTVSGQIHFMHRQSGQLEAAPEKRPQGHGGRPSTVYRATPPKNLSANAGRRADLYRRKARLLRELAQLEEDLGKLELSADSAA